MNRTIATLRLVNITVWTVAGALSLAAIGFDPGAWPLWLALTGLSFREVWRSAISQNIEQKAQFRTGWREFRQERALAALERRLGRAS